MLRIVLASNISSKGLAEYSDRHKSADELTTPPVHLHGISSSKLAFSQRNIFRLSNLSKWNVASVGGILVRSYSKRWHFCIVAVFWNKFFSRSNLPTNLCCLMSNTDSIQPYLRILISLLDVGFIQHLSKCNGWQQQYYRWWTLQRKTL